MGLDTHIYVRKKPTRHEEILRRLVGEREKWDEILYWRKVWDIVDFFGVILGGEIENCKEYDLSEDNLRELLVALKEGTIHYPYDDEDELRNEHIEVLEKFLKETNFKGTEIIFSNWW